MGVTKSHEPSIIGVNTLLVYTSLSEIHVLWAYRQEILTVARKILECSLQLRPQLCSEDEATTKKKMMEIKLRRGARPKGSM